jgi:hypothetical protein
LFAEASETPLPPPRISRATVSAASRSRPGRRILALSRLDTGYISATMLRCTAILSPTTSRAVLLGDGRPVGQAPADLLESCELGLERLGHGTAAAEAGGNSGERRHHEHGC